MYHDVAAEGPTAGLPRTATMYHISRHRFHAHLEAVRASGLPVLTAAESLRAERDHVVITFDDGWAGSLSIGVECLAAAGMRGTFYVTRDRVGTSGFADPATLLAAAKAGMELGTHGCSHRLLGVQPEPVVREELTQAKSYLEDLLGAPVMAGSAPGGSWSAAVARVAREAGYASLSVSLPGAHRLGDDPFQVRRLAVRASTGADVIARWSRFSVAREVVRHDVFDFARRILGAERYARVRRRLLGTVPQDDVVLVVP